MLWTVPAGLNWPRLLPGTCRRRRSSTSPCTSSIAALAKQPSARSTAIPIPSCPGCGGRRCRTHPRRNPFRRNSWPRLGKFELLEELGLGSFGQVFRARDTELGRIVAIKLLRAGRLASREEIDRFVREARSAAQLKHPGLVTLYETGETEDGVFYLV